MPKVSQKRSIRNRAKTEVDAIFERRGKTIPEESQVANPGTSQCSQEAGKVVFHQIGHFDGPLFDDDCEACNDSSSLLTGTGDAAVAGSSRSTDSQLKLPWEKQSSSDNSNIDIASTLAGNADVCEQSIFSIVEKHVSASEFASELAKWALKDNIPHSSLNSLLALLKSHHCFCNFPKDARTLLKTPRTSGSASGILVCPPGHYCHFGVEKGLRDVLHGSQHTSAVVSTSVNIDGLPLAKSSRLQLWPIQCLAHLAGTPGNVLGPFVAGAFAGYGKPDCADAFLRPFVDEMKTLIEEGISISGEAYKVEIKNFICDAPARAFIFKTKGHSGYSGCPKCTAEGSFGEKLFFPAEVSPLRTDQSFRSQADPEHHQGISVLTKLPFDCISCVPLDPMHLLYLGVVRRLVHFWLAGSLRVRLGPADRREISARSAALQPHVPMEFVRKPRSLEEKDRWKATEYRTLLLYSGPVILQETLPEGVFSNFLTLHVAATILSSSSLCQEQAGYAETLLQHFVKGFARLYGEQEVSYNVHCLLHLAADSSLHGTLESFSAFPFENNMQVMKKLLRKHGCALSQIHKRLEERRAHKLQKAGKKLAGGFVLSGSHDDGSIPPDCKPPSYKEVRFATFTLSTKAKDSFCQINNDIVVIEAFAHRKSDGRPCISGRKFCDVRPLYTKPLDSRRLGIAVVNELSSRDCWPIEGVKKLVKLPYKDRFVVMPLLHTA